MPKDTRARLIEAAAGLLQHRGYHGTALSDILTKSGAPRGSLYFHFPGGKDQLVIEAIRATVDKITLDLRDSLAAATNPANAVRGVMEATAGVLRDSNFTFGCPAAPAILDGTADVPELIELCRNALEGWIGLLRASFVEAGIPPKRAEALALLAQSSFEGAMLIARAYRDCAPMMTVATELEAIIAAALPRKEV